MKNLFTAALALIGIIGVQMIISYAFSWQAADLFSKVSLTALFTYYLCKVFHRKRKTA